MKTNKEHHIGITGSRSGMTDMQRDLISQYLNIQDHLVMTKLVLHHGDCVGVDDQTNRIAKSKGIYTVCHPPVATDLRAYSPSDEIRSPHGYLHRDRNIVDNSEILLAVSGSNEETFRSGTWYTIRYAYFKADIPVLCFLPNGLTYSGERLESLFLPGKWGV